MTETDRTQLVFIPGLHRCGSTWVTHWLNEHPEVHVEPENYAFLRSVSKGESSSDTRKICESFFEKKRPAEKSIFVDKSPRGITINGEHVGRVIHSVFPEAKVVIFYKYLPDYIFSLMHLPEWGRNRTVKEAFDDCMLNAPQIEAYEDRRILYVRYEDLISKPRTCAERMMEFLGVSLHRSLIPWERPLNTVQQSYDEKRWQVLLAEYSKELSLLNPELRRLDYPECV